MKRSINTSAMAISVLFGGRSADAFVSRGGVISSPKIQNPNRRITIRSDDHMPLTPAGSHSSRSVCDMSNDNYDHMPSTPAASYSSRSACDMSNDKSSVCDTSHDFSRREMMDITLGAITGWCILGPRVTFAVTSSSLDNIEEMIRTPSEG